jgi:chemotaxis protein MotB
MALHQEPEKPTNNERWIISYADFTTLLLATFVVMYAVSSINSSKFQEMAEAFSTAFIGRTVTVRDTGFSAPNKAPFDFMPSPVHLPIITREEQVKSMPIAIRQQQPERAPPEAAPKTPPAPPQQSQQAPPLPDTMATTVPTAVPEQGPIVPNIQQQVQQRVEQLDAAYEQLRKALSTLIGKGEVRVSLQSLGVVIDINEVLLFNSGKAELVPKALPLIDQIAGILKGLPYQIQVNGFTDNRPIHNAQFESNWDLSAIRAVSVVKRFVTVGIDPALLVGAGFGEYHPVAPNSTAEGKTMNRRVSIVVVSPIRGGASALQTPLLGSPLPRSGGPAPSAPRSP